MEFRYRALDSVGVIVEGTLLGSDESEVLHQLEVKSLTVVQLAAVNSSGSLNAQSRRHASAQEKESALRELATLLTAGIVLAEAVDSIGQGYEKSLVGVAFAKIGVEIRQGHRFAQALQDAQLELPDYVYQLVAASELTGKLAKALHDAATQMGYDERVKQETRNALVYPLVLIVTGLAATLFMFIVVVPKFAGLLKNRSDLPWISEVVLKLGLEVSQNLLWLAMATLVVCFLLVSLLRRPGTRDVLITTLSRLPMTGRWLIESDIGRWATVLSILLENRVPILQAMELAKQGIKLPGLRATLQNATRDLKAGGRLADSLRSSGMFAATALNLIRAGEATAELPATLKTLATFYDSASQARMKRFLVLLEPVAILAVGGGIGIIMVAIMLAITSMSTMPH